jgi:hypothetical protein
MEKLDNNITPYGDCKLGIYVTPDGTVIVNVIGNGFLASLLQQRLSFIDEMTVIDVTTIRTVRTDEDAQREDTY